MDIVVQTSDLTPTERNFAHYLVADPQMNQTEAMLKVNPDLKQNSASTMGGKMLKKPEVRAYIAKLLEERQQRLEMDEDWVIMRLRDIHDRCMQSTPVWEGKRYERDDESGEMEEKEPSYYKFDAPGALKALELIGRHMRMFSDKVDSGSLTVGVSINLGNEQPAIEGKFQRGTKG